MNLYHPDTKYPSWITAFKDFDCDVSMNPSFIVLYFASLEQAKQAETIAFLMNFRTRIVHAHLGINRPHRVVIYFSPDTEKVCIPL